VVVRSVVSWPEEPWREEEALAVVDEEAGEEQNSQNSLETSG